MGYDKIVYNRGQHGALEGGPCGATLNNKNQAGVKGYV